MADEKTVVKGTKESFGAKFVGFCKRLPGAIARPFKNMWHELRKVTWPSRDKLVNYSTIVVLFIVFMMVVIGLLDLGASQLVNLIMSL